MPINYGDVVSYNAVTGWNSAGDGTNWQVNPARILQIRTATGSVSNESSSDYVNVTSVQMKRTKPDSIFYAQIAGRASSGTVLAYGGFVYTFEEDRTTTLTITDSTTGQTYTYTYVGFDSSINKFAEWSNVNTTTSGVTATSRKIVWNDTEVYSNASRVVPPNSVYTEFSTGDEFTGNDGYQYKIGDLEYSSTSTINGVTVGTKRYEIARRYLSASAANTGEPEVRIRMMRLDGTYQRTLGGSWTVDEEFNLPTQNSALPRGEATFELSAFYQPTKTYYPHESTVFISLEAKNDNSGGIVNIGQNCEYFNVASLRVYEIDNGTSTFIMKPDDAAFTDTEGITGTTGDPFSSSYVRTTGYGIPNHWWINRDTMYSPGVRCLIPNHNVAGEWIAFGEGFQMTDGIDTSDANTGWSHMYTTRSRIAAMITDDNGVTWQEMDDSTYSSSTDYFPPIVFDWATNGNTDPDDALWLIGGYERQREPSAGSLELDGDICLYRNSVSAFGNEFDDWDLKFVERDTAARVIGGSTVVPSNSGYQFITSVCYSNGYFVIANNLGRTNRATEANVKTGAGLIAFDGWVNCWGVSDTAAGANQINCLTSNDGGSKIMAGGDNKILFSDNSGQTWSDSFAIMQGYSPGDFSPATIPHISGTASPDYLKAVHNITYVAGEVYVGSVKKGPGVWIACGFKSPDYDALHANKTPLYAYCDETEDRVNGLPVWHEIDVANDTNLPTGSQYNVRERIVSTGNGTLMTWAGAGPGLSGPKSDMGGTSSSQLYSQQADSYRFGSLDGDGSNTKSGQTGTNNSIGGVRAKLNTNGYPDSSYGSPDANGVNWDSSKASFWVSYGSLTDWIQVSSGTPFIGASYSGTANAPTDVGDSGPGNTSAPNVFQMKADGWSNGRYMVGSVGGEVYNKAGGRIAFIDIPE
tara:strand:+ start:3012 stop:5774 length:2763 start_codon:yes stop_codon:yes gene_type:complete